MGPLEEQVTSTLGEEKFGFAFPSGESSEVDCKFEAFSKDVDGVLTFWDHTSTVETLWNDAVEYGADW